MENGYRTVDSIEQGLPYPVVALGFFDGVHLGHQVILDLVQERAQSHGGTSMVLTLDQHPLVVISKEEPPQLLTTLPERIDLLLASGVNRVVTVGFNQEFASMSPEEFVEEILVQRLQVKEVVAGHDYRFGHRASGDMALMKQLGKKFGFSVLVVAPVEREGARVSSTKIRRLLQEEGNVEAAAKLLQREYSLQGIVVPGKQRGRKLGFPTANIQVDAHKIVPADGVYAVKVYLPEGYLGGGGAEVQGLNGRDQWFTGVLSISHNPTFDEKQRTVEVHLLDFSGDIYGRNLRLEFIQYLRPIYRFEAVADLVKQVEQDKATARVLLEEYR